MRIAFISLSLEQQVQPLVLFSMVPSNWSASCQFLGIRGRSISPGRKTALNGLSEQTLGSRRIIRNPFPLRSGRAISDFICRRTNSRPQEVGERLAQAENGGEHNVWSGCSEAG